MIDLRQSTSASPVVHSVPHDPGTSWASQSIAIDAPPDNDLNPSPAARWEAAAVRTGLCGAVAPRVVALASGGYRMYYTQILPRAGFPNGANDYGNAASRILSATSVDGATWHPEPGVRLSPQEGGAGTSRVVSAEVVPMRGTDGWLRMYYECCGGTQTQQNSIRSARSEDGVAWTVEEGIRFELTARNVSSPRIIFLDDGRCRLYCGQYGQGILSAVSADDGLSFEQEPGIRIAPETSFDRFTAFAAEIMLLPDGTYRMYYAGYGTPKRADILTAVSDDGLTWHKITEPVISPSFAGWDAAKCSEMCVVWSTQARDTCEGYRMLYEACDGTAQDQRGVWRIANAISAA